MKLKKSTLINYVEDSFTDWHEKLGAAPGYIAVDAEEGKLVKQWGEVLDLQQAEMDLNELGYTLGLGGQNG